MNSKHETVVNIPITDSHVFIASYVLGLCQMLGLFLSRLVVQRDSCTTPGQSTGKYEMKISPL